MATINQRIVFKNTSTKELYDLYMNAKLHGQIAGGRVKVSEKPGSPLEAFDGYIKGKTLMVVKDQLIVQSWRGSDWSPTEPDSAFVLAFEQKGKDAIMHVCHANVPDAQAKGLDKGWRDFYWNPWKQHLSGKSVTRPEH